MASSWLPAANAALPFACKTPSHTFRCINIKTYCTDPQPKASRTLKASDAIAAIPDH